ncbi:MAG TPA: histidine phosphatase family protein [Devosia sp.]|jgi:broad specificity phosphatase PhoE|uniref:histidine phosphatase family protein n=1 Tax=Devosia sp. TaxID=1871048 RepID=UPI002F9289BE
MRALYVTHPQVQLDPDVPVPQWGLSGEGRGRAEALAARGVVPEGAWIFSSDERKAMELADILAATIGGVVRTDPLMGENDRSATGFLPPAEFEAHADCFFAAPEVSVGGWERAIDAQSRIVRAVAAALGNVPDDVPVVFCGHGAVGTLLKCHVAGRPIHRGEDQRRQAHSGGGNCFSFDLFRKQLGSEWTLMEAFAPDWFVAPVAAPGQLL